MLLCLRMAVWQEGEERDYNMKTGTCPAYCAGCVPVIVCGMWLCLRAFTACVGIAVHAGGYTNIKIQAVNAGGCTSIKSKPQTAGKWGGISPLLSCLRLVVCSLWSVVCSLWSVVCSLFSVSVFMVLVSVSCRYGASMGLRGSSACVGAFRVLLP